MHTGHLLTVALIFLLATVIAVPLAKRFKLGAVLGYLIAGALIGPHVLHLINNPDNVASVSELGIVLLLFIIGLELSPHRLWVMRRAVFGTGLAQVLASGLVIAALAYWGFHLPGKTALVIGFGLALSSTAFGLQILAERKELATAPGRQAFAVLLFQDLAAIPLIAAVPLLGGVAVHSTGGDGHSGMAALRVVLAIALVVIGGRYLLRPLFRMVARTNLLEVSVAMALLVVLGTAWLMEQVGVSMALGAFLAGVLLADSEYRHELESHLEPFKGLLLGLFFISVGMSADLPLLLHKPVLVLALVLALSLLKAPLLWLAGRVLGKLDGRDGLRLAILLASGGEFAFVVFKLAADEHLLSAGQHHLLVLVITLSMAATPLLVLTLARLLGVRPKQPTREFDAIDAATPRVIIAGFGRVGQIVTRVLRAQHIPFVALENSIDQVDASRRFGGTSIFYGDPARADLLRAAQADKAEVFVLATDDPQANVRTARIVRQLYPHLKIVARARNRQHAFRLMDLNADAVVRETFHSSLEMTRDVLKLLGLPDTLARERVERFRQQDEALLRTQHLVYDDETQLVQTMREASAELEQLFDADEH
ncbi:MAG: monovalent cation:proton antiporter-2 (CPA2) family protein [Xanthomonadales bacterium]|nr:monovalent cation:proton antiporter-2 (CPA2) family protein [Xanthomonadales bacterium]